MGSDPAQLDVGPLSMPARWKNTHDCERPARWREEMDEEDCEIWRLGGLPDENERAYDVGGSSRGTDSGYSELVPNLDSMETFLAAMRLSGSRNKLLLLKFYSKRCRACLRIASKYRRLALKYADQIDCYECEQSVCAPELLQALSVTQVPTVQMFDGPEVVDRLADLSAQPSQFKLVESTLQEYMAARRPEGRGQQPTEEA